LVLFPCLFLVLTIVAINFVGDGLRDAFDPKSGMNRA
jgi:peptide/nickel transport system permease protein